MPDVRFFGAPPPLDREAKVADGVWRVPEETPVAFVYNGRNYAVMLATPGDLADFAVGFSLTERVVDALDEIEAIDIHQSDAGVELHMKIAPEKLERLDLRQRRRNLVGRAGCGVCGLESAETFFEKLPRVSAIAAKVNEAALLRALEEFRNHQSLNERTHTVHGAAFARTDGAIEIAREDVGRHNALDKLLGALALKGDVASDGFLVMSSRCSYEIIEKAARRGVCAILSLSAPTAFAIRKAKEANISLYCRTASGVTAIL